MFLTHLKSPTAIFLILELSAASLWGKTLNAVTFWDVIALLSLVPAKEKTFELHRKKLLRKAIASIVPLFSLYRVNWTYLDCGWGHLILRDLYKRDEKK